MLVKCNWLVIPKTLRKKVLCRLHAGHQGVSKCRERAEMSVWEPGLSAQVQETVAKCPTCIEERMTASKLPHYSWQQVGADLYSNSKATTT